MEIVGGGLVALSLVGLLAFSRDTIFLLIYMELGVLGIFLLFSHLSISLEDGGIQGYLLILLGLGAVDSVVGIVLVLTLFERTKDIFCI